MSLERHERLKIVVSGVLIGGLAMAIAPCTTQGDVLVRHTSRSLALPDLQLQNYLFEDNSIEHIEQNPEKPPPRIAEEIFAGVVGGLVGGAIGGGIGWAIGSGVERGSEPLTEYPELLGAALGATVGYVLGSPIGVYNAGDTENETGNFLATLGGGVAGGFLGLLIGGVGALPGIPIGATVGFNMTRRYKTPPPPENGLINIKDGRMRLATPKIYLQPDPLDKKTLIHNADLVIATF
ncbi:hypothetical protein E3J62_07905 [candidate division TA06 bacterium]|uniref:Glycine zipper domain-containing protein n=1 Tax=candidate division TA06 bacterium TaxID=2250710 RepID=A0A523URX5_UNCT6|nr:MAG: hypothetical protein E3J62_07905 [candidate division TA06 bacterium]